MQKAREEYTKLAVFAFYNSIKGLPEMIVSSAMQGYCTTLYLHELPDGFIETFITLPEFDAVAAKISEKEEHIGLGLEILRGEFEPIKESFTNIADAFKFVLNKTGEKEEK